MSKLRQISIPDKSLFSFIFLFCAFQFLYSQPFSFRKNSGQWDKQILYRGFSNSWGANINFLANGVSFGFKKELAQHSENESKKSKVMVWNVRFINANKKVKVLASDEQKSDENYFIGNNPEEYVLNASDYFSVNYQNIYNKIDLSYYNSHGNIEYDYIIKPNGKVSDILMKYDGVESLSINEKQQLEIKTIWGILLEDKPIAYQKISNEKKAIPVQFRILENNTVGFSISGLYDINYELVIDPVILKWATYTGGNHPGGIANGSSGHQLKDIAVDANGDIYCVGSYDDTNFPVTPGVYDNSHNGNTDIIVYKMNSTGTNMLWCTYIGGSSLDDANAIDIDAIGNAYITGKTQSANFPTSSGAYDITYGGKTNAIFCKLSSTGTNLLYSTFLGGSTSSIGTLGSNGNDISVQQSTGDVYLTGDTRQTDFPVTTGAYNTSGNLVGIKSDAFFSKISPNGNGASDLLYSTYLSGTGFDFGINIAINSNGSAVISGNTESSNFPTTAGCFDTSFNGVYDAFISIISPNGNGNADLSYSTFFGGGGPDSPGSSGGGCSRSMALNVNGEIFIGGQTSSADMPITPGAYDTQSLAIPPGVNETGFAFRLNPLSAGFNDLVYSTYIGGNVSNAEESVQSIALTTNNELFLTGHVVDPIANNFNVSPCSYLVQPSYASWMGLFVGKLSNDGKKMLYSGYVDVGSVANDDFESIGLHALSCGTYEIVIGSTCPPVNPSQHRYGLNTTPGAFQECINDSLNSAGFKTISNGALIKLAQKITPDFKNDTVCWGLPTTFTNNTFQCGLWDSVKTWFWDFGDGTTSALQNPTHMYVSPGQYQVKLKLSCSFDSIIKTVLIFKDSTYAGNDTAICRGNIIHLNAPGGASSYSWSPSQGISCSTCQSANALPLSTTKYSLTIQQLTGCLASDTVLITVNSNTVSAKQDTSICKGNTMNLGTNGSAVSYQWIPSAGLFCSSCQNTTATPGSSINYYITTMDINGCINTDSIMVTVDTVIVNAYAGSDTSICAGKFITLNASGGISYYWNTGSTSSSITVSPDTSMNYKVVVSNSSCHDSDDIYVTINPNPNPFVTNNTTIISGNNTTLSVNGGVFYQWFPATGLSCATCNVITISPNQTSTFYVLVTDNNGCTSMDSIVVTVQNEHLAGNCIFVPNVFSPNGDGQNDVERIYGSACIKKILFKIYDRWGNKVYETTNTIDHWDGTYKGKMLNSDVFIYSLMATTTDDIEVFTTGKYNPD